MSATFSLRRDRTPQLGTAEGSSLSVCKTPALTTCSRHAVAARSKTAAVDREPSSRHGCWHALQATHLFIVGSLEARALMGVEHDEVDHAVNVRQKVKQPSCILLCRTPAVQCSGAAVQQPQYWSANRQAMEFWVPCKAAWSFCCACREAQLSNACRHQQQHSVAQANAASQLGQQQRLLNRAETVGQTDFAVKIRYM